MHHAMQAHKLCKTKTIVLIAIRYADLNSQICSHLANGVGQHDVREDKAAHCVQMKGLTVMAPEGQQIWSPG